MIGGVAAGHVRYRNAAFRMAPGQAYTKSH
jgi:hypothetical protein